mmetsp:Transcript_64850/g.76133  ORF Transcript_64850/g.76133 Transcript_64850/m.76133 type:complete len:466 (-) Transcript_64850:56-1453(-)
MFQQLKKPALKAAAASTAIILSIEVTTQLPSEGRSSKTYHKFVDSVATPFIRNFTDPETAHTLALQSVKNNLAPRYYAPSKNGSITTTMTPFEKAPHLTFPNPVGLAAGFDKDGIAIPELFTLGFGFVEIGSVTPLAQPGNPKPRIFRLKNDKGVINRYGFNSLGGKVAEGHLQTFRGLNGDGGETQSEASKDVEETNYLNSVWNHVLEMITVEEEKPKGVLGVNLGKNKLSTEETADYEHGIKELGPYADYIVINISSPNTPGLRNLQQLEPLRRLLQCCVESRNKLHSKDTNTAYIPLVVKIAPDLSIDEMKDIATVIKETKGVDGLIVSNTTNSRPSTLTSPSDVVTQTGGLSGEPLRDLSTECIRQMYRFTDGSIPIIGVGGVGNGVSAYEKLKAGASLVQVYSMMVYEGPGVVTRIRHELSDLIANDGYTSVEDVIGRDHDEIFWRRKEQALKSKFLSNI